MKYHEKKESISFHEVFRLCITLLKKERMVHIGNASIWLFISIVPVIVGLLIKHIFNALELREIETYFLNISILCIVMLLNVLCTYTGGKLDTKSRFYIGRSLKVHLFAYYITHMHRLKSTEIINTFHTDIAIIEEFISFCMDFINKILFFIFAFFILMEISLPMTVFVVIPLIFATFLISCVGNSIKKHYSEAKDEDIRTIALFEDIVLGHHTLASFSLKNDVLEYLEKKLASRKTKNRKKELLFQCIESFIEFFNAVVQLLIMIASIYFLPIKNGIGSFTLFIEYMSYVGIYLVIFQEIFIKYKSIQRFLLSMTEKLNITSGDLLSILLGEENKKERKIQFPIEFKDFRFEKHQEKFNGEIREGDILSIEGDVGMAQARFLSCLFGHSSYFGDVLFQHTKLQNEIVVFAGYVPQNTQLFNGSLLDNITLCQQTIDECKLDYAIEVANLKDPVFLEYRLNKNISIGPNGKKLSEGQRQRVAIARALYNETSSFLVLDRCFQNMDEDNRNHIMKRLLESSYTILFVGIPDVNDMQKWKTRNILHISTYGIRMEETTCV